MSFQLCLPTYCISEERGPIAAGNTIDLKMAFSSVLFTMLCVFLLVAESRLLLKMKKEALIYLLNFYITHLPYKVAYRLENKLENNKNILKY